MSKAVLSDRRVLLFCPQFFGYDRAIKSELENMGAQVLLFDERPSNNALTKILLRINLSKALPLAKRYYDSIFRSLPPGSHDYVIFISPEAATEREIKELRTRNPDATFVLYTWDSFHNKKRPMELASSFDRLYTFDPSDVRRDTRFKLRPLFFTGRHRGQPAVTAKAKYELAFCGTVHSDRYRIVRAIEDECRKKGVRFFSYKFCPGKTWFYLRKIFDVKFRNARLNEMEFTPLEKVRLQELMASTACLLDIHHPEQVGLTMRTFEALGAGKKLLTTNPKVIEYDFYRASNILVVPRNRVELNKAFFESEVEPLAEATMRKYSLRGWLEEILGLDQV